MDSIVHAVSTEIIGSKIRHTVTRPHGMGVLTLMTVPDEPAYPYPGYRNPLGYGGEQLAQAEKWDRERHEEHCRQHDAMRERQRAAMKALADKFINGNINPGDVGMSRRVDTTKPFKVARTKTPWTPKPFGVGDWVLVGADRMEGQIWGVSKNELQIVVTFPDGRNRAIHVTRSRTGAEWQYEETPIVRMHEEIQPTMESG